MKNKNLLLYLLISLFFLTACASPQVDNTDEPASVTQTSIESTSNSPTETPTITPTPFPFGTVENPIVLGIVYTDEDSQYPAAQDFVQYLADTTSYIFQLQSFSTDKDLLTAMEQGQVSFAWMQPIPYLYASEMGIASVALLSNHYGIYYYGSQFLANINQNFTNYFDSTTGRTTDSAEIALLQFTDKTPCFVDQKSLSGYVVPAGLLNDSGVSIESPIFLKTHEAVLRALYAGGICDFGVTYGLVGDPRTASTIQNDLPDFFEKVVIIWQSDPVIPTLNLSYSSFLPKEIQDQITKAILKKMSLPEGPSLVSTMNNYNIEELNPVGDNAYESLRGLLQSSGVDLDSLLE